jgi:aminopeptidase N
LATQLQAIHARNVFPSFDEPAFRAVFEITVRAPKAFDVVSNMPRASRTLESEFAVHRFAPTPPMPTYLVSVAVGNFDVLSGTAAGVPLRILTALGKREFARHAMRTTRQVLPYLSWYFGVPYALPKLDQFAAPSVRWGAMEDWGLISYAESEFLVDPQRSSPDTVRGSYDTIAHEIAHQWFGNLVTAASWEEIWLNEAFATWLARKTTDHFNPEWKIPLESRLPIDRAMTLDAGTATRAIRSGPVRESAVNDVFDEITYAKGGAVLTMLEQWIGPAEFRRGLVAYMKGQRLSNATAADLWHYIGQASGKDVAGVAASWTDQQGFPLVHVSSRCEAGEQRITLTQSRFTNAGPSGSAQLWKIPLRYTRGKREATLLLDAPQRTVAVGDCSNVPVVVNAGGVGFYRVAYEADTLAALTRHFVDLGQADRVSLLSDAFALVQAGQLPLQSYLDILQSLPRINDDSRTMLWSVARTQLDFLDVALAGRPAQKRLRTIGRDLLAPQLAKLTWTPAPKEDEQTAELRGDLIGSLARFDHAPTIALAIRAFDDDDAGTAKLPASLRRPVTLATGMHADRAHFERLLARLAKAAGEEERWMLASALAAGRDAQRAEELLAMSLKGLAPANVSSSIPGLVARRSPFGDLAYRYALDNWKPLAELAGTGGRAYVLPGAARGFNTAEQADRLVEDQRRNAGVDGDMLAAQEAEAIRLRAAVKEREAPGLERAMAD